MKHKTFIYLSFFMAVILFACSKDNNTISQTETLRDERTTANIGAGATQISGIGYYVAAGECDYASQGAVYAIRMTGDFEGCLYAFIDDFECSPSGTYREEGREYFVGTYNGQSGIFWTTYKI